MKRKASEFSQPASDNIKSYLVETYALNNKTTGLYKFYVHLQFEYILRPIDNNSY